MSLNKLEGIYYEAYKNQVRDIETPKSQLPPALARLGRQIAQDIMKRALGVADPVSVTTPQGKTVIGPVPKLPQTVVITTKQERSYLGAPIRDELGAYYSGYLDFGNLRGEEVLNCEPAEMAWPTVNGRIELLVIAKSVLASGCTALALAQRAIARFQPSKIVIASIFYSDRGVFEMQNALPNAEIFVLGEADRLTSDGMLEPGVGLIEERIFGNPSPLFDDSQADHQDAPIVSVPDSALNLAFARIDELAKIGLTGISPLESFALANHFVNIFVAAQSVGQGAPADLMASIDLMDAEQALEKIRHP